MILFIDELHTVVGAGRAEGGSDAANLLKPALARGDLRCIGATTLDEYHKYIEKDAALERRFQPVTVGEPSVEDTLAILRGLKPRYEAHHKGVKIKDSALVAAANLAHRYIADRFLPDKAIDLMDEATSRLAIELESVPAEIDQVQRRLVQLELAARQLQGEQEEHARQRLAEIRRRFPRSGRSWPGCASNGSRKRAGWATSTRSAGRLADVELQFNQLSAAIKEKQSSGIPSARRITSGSTRSTWSRSSWPGNWRSWKRRRRSAGQGRPAADCARRWARMRSPTWSPPGPESR